MVSFVLGPISSAQNLVPNGSFEKFIECPKDYTHLGEKLNIDAWYSPTKSTPDYYNACSRFNVGVPNNFMGNCFAANGNAYVGLLLSEQPDRVAKGEKPFNQREYLQVELNEELAPGKRYCVGLSYCVAPRSAFAVNGFGICLSNKRIKSKMLISCQGEIAIDTSTIETETGIWHELSDTVLANGGEQYLTIGNFYDDTELDFEPLNLSGHRNSVKKAVVENGYAYYFIDSVFVVLVGE